MRAHERFKQDCRVYGLFKKLLKENGVEVTPDDDDDDETTEPREEKSFDRMYTKRKKMFLALSMPSSKNIGLRPELNLCLDCKGEPKTVYEICQRQGSADSDLGWRITKHEECTLQLLPPKCFDAQLTEDEAIGMIRKLITYYLSFPVAQ